MTADQNATSSKVFLKDTDTIRDLVGDKNRGPKQQVLGFDTQTKLPLVFLDK